MSTLQVANINFESTGNTGVRYIGTNSFIFVSAGSNSFLVNSSSVSIGPANSNLISVTSAAATVGGVVANSTVFRINTTTGFMANNSLGSAGQALLSNGTGLYWGGGGASLNANNTDSVTYYIPMSNTTTGSWINAVISTTKLYFVPSTGTLSATDFNSLSDITYKTDIQQITTPLDTIVNLRGVQFKWKENDKKSMGVIAQEVEKVLPELVTETNGTKQVNYNGFIGLLIESIKELKHEIETLKQEKH